MTPNSSHRPLTGTEASTDEGFARRRMNDVAGLAAIGHLISLPLYPLWGLAVLALDVAVIHALLAHGGQHREV